MSDEPPKSPGSRGSASGGKDGVIADQVRPSPASAPSTSSVREPSTPLAPWERGRHDSRSARR